VVDDEEIRAENFGNLNALTEYLQRKLS